MDLEQGISVRTEGNEVGKVVSIDGPTAFVSFATADQPHDIRQFLKSALTLIDRQTDCCRESAQVE
jgi:hypothetical protein